MAQTNITVYFTLLVLAVYPLSVHGDKILLLPGFFVSHVRQFHIIGETLHDAGHDVHIAFSETFPDLDFLKESKVNIIKHRAERHDFFTLPQDEMMDLMDSAFQAVLPLWRENREVFLNLCTNLISDDEFYKQLHDLNFDLAIVDSFPISRCLLYLTHDLNLPFVSVSTFFEPWIMRNPALPSFVPSNILPNIYTDKMSFFERLSNLWQNIDFIATPRINFIDDNTFKDLRRSEDKPSMVEIARRSLLYFIDDDPLMDYPRPTMPNEINIGGFSITPVKPLPRQLEEIMESSQDGVIVMTFGTLDFTLTSDVIEEYMRAFSLMPYTVVWKYGQVVAETPPNVKQFKWLPQTDLLAHEKTKLFITHCGNGGQFEALRHAVPMLGMPVFGDQPYNCKRMEALGYGICLHTHMVKGNVLVSAIEELMKNDTYSKNIEVASAIYKDRPENALHRFLYWINHVLKFGGKHLRSHALDMPWYEYLMLDILAFIVLSTLLVVVIIGILLNFLLRYQKV